MLLLLIAVIAVATVTVASSAPPQQPAGTQNVAGTGTIHQAVAHNNQLSGSLEQPTLGWKACQYTEVTPVA